MSCLNGTGEIGLIESVSLKNFMCHGNLTLSFGPHVNFVLGKNGSGKSAVLAAIITALGGKVSSTGRGRNIKNIIQKGKTSATVSVSLKNTGSDAFHPERYGPTLTVERRLNIDGTSFYKLKNSRGGVVSTKKVDLNAILVGFNIQVQNPVAILTQELSKSFLNSKDGKDKYSFFCKATQLESLETMYKQAEDQRMAASDIIESKEPAFSRLKFEIMELEKKLKDYGSLENQREQLGELYKEFAWAVVIEKEECIQQVHIFIKKMESTAETARKKLRCAEVKYRETVAKENSTKENIVRVQSEIKSIKEQEKHLNKMKINCQQKIRETQGIIQKLNRKINDQEKQICYLINAIAERVQRAEADLERERLEREAKVQEHQQKVEQMTANILSLNQKLEHEREVHSNLKTEIGKDVNESRSLRYRIEATEKEIKKIKHCLLNRDLAYGKNMPLFLVRIQEAADKKKFKHVPKGPLGLYVKVKDPQWTLAIECCLGTNLLRSFLCDNDDDREVLYNIMQTVFPNKMPQIITGKFSNQVYDVSSGRVEDLKFLCVLDVLDIDDPVIMNCLIDERGIESIILIPSNVEARQVMMYSPPRKCSEAFTLKANCVFPSPSFRFYSNKKKFVSLISNPLDLSAKVGEKTQELEVLRATYQKYESNMVNLHKKKEAQEHIISQNEAQVARIRSLIFREEAEVKVMEVPAEPSVVIRSLEDELKNAKPSAENLRIHREEKLVVLENCKKEANNIASEVQILQTAFDEKNTKLNALTNSAVAETSKNIFEEMKTCEKKYKEISQKLSIAKCKCEDQLSIAKGKVAEAEKVCPRIETQRKPEDIEALIIQTKEIIDQGKENQGNILEILDLHKSRRQEYQEVQNELKRMKSFLRKCEGTMAQRLQAFEQLRTYVSLRVQYLFIANLHIRGYVGKLKFDHTNRLLEVYAKPSSSSAVQATRSLSGGEKSFVTVALLLALWDAVEIPFRILDEYDVYMDQVNRKRSMDLMLSTALERSSTQFIFLSPLELVKITPSEKIHIMYMPDPEREKRNGEELMEVE